MHILKHWWKAVAVIQLLYVLLAGLLHPVPRLPILHEAIRNTFFHPPLWISMMVMLLISTIFSIRYLKNGKITDDVWAAEFARTALLFGILGCITGSVWAYFAWGALWPNDPKTNGVAIAMLMYFAYFILRGSLQDSMQKARLSAIYNIFAFSVFIPLIFILPRLTDSLHPGNGGNPGFNQYDADGSITWIIRPAFVGFTLMGVWMTNLRMRARTLECAMDEMGETGAI
jgi:heme exporter protein C